MTISALSPATRPAPGKTRILSTACSAHALHDGLTDTLYLLLPLWQVQFALSYAAIGLLRAVYTGAMASLQVPMAGIGQRFGAVRVLVIGTAIAAAGYLLLGASSGVALLVCGLVLGGIGSSVQHPIAAALVAGAYDGPRARAALGTYNFAGDLGKMALPSLAAVLIAMMSWRAAASVIGAVGLLAAAGIMLVLPRASVGAARPPQSHAPAEPTSGYAALMRGGFPLLLAIGVIDSATRMGFLTFLPFLLRAKGAAVPEIGGALTLVFAGGAAGKLACGFLGARRGILATVLITEGATAAGIIALLALPLGPALALLPVIGIALNGTSSVLYGTVPDLVGDRQRETAFGVFYTGTIGAGALSPALYGLLGDAIGLKPALVLVAGAVLLTLPLAWRLTRGYAAAAPRVRPAGPARDASAAGEAGGG